MTLSTVLSLVIGAVGSLSGAAAAIAMFMQMRPQKASRIALHLHHRLNRVAMKRALTKEKNRA